MSLSTHELEQGDLFTGTWNIRETKIVSKITMKSSIFNDKVIINMY
jgi:hypothetical protein